MYNILHIGGGKPSRKKYIKEITMSTLALNSAGIAISGGKVERPGLFARFVKHREQVARAHVVSYLAKLSDEHLASLGFDSEGIAALRRGEYKLPKQSKAAA